MGAAYWRMRADSKSVNCGFNSYHLYKHRTAGCIQPEMWRASSNSWVGNLASLFTHDLSTSLNCQSSRKAKTAIKVDVSSIPCSSDGRAPLQNAARAGSIPATGTQVGQMRRTARPLEPTVLRVLAAPRLRHGDKPYEMVHSTHAGVVK